MSRAADQSGFDVADFKEIDMSVAWNVLDTHKCMWHGMIGCEMIDYDVLIWPFLHIP